MTASHVWAWIAKFKYQNMALQNKKTANENRNIFQQIWFLRSNYNSKTISTCYDRSDALSHVELAVVS